MPLFAVALLMIAGCTPSSPATTTTPSSTTTPPPTTTTTPSTETTETTNTIDSATSPATTVDWNRVLDPPSQGENVVVVLGELNGGRQCLYTVDSAGTAATEAYCVPDPEGVLGKHSKIATINGEHYVAVSARYPAQQTGTSTKSLLVLLVNLSAHTSITLWEGPAISEDLEPTDLTLDARELIVLSPTAALASVIRYPRVKGTYEELWELSSQHEPRHIELPGYDNIHLNSIVDGRLVGSFGENPQVFGYVDSTGAITTAPAGYATPSGSTSTNKSVSLASFGPNGQLLLIEDYSDDFNHANLAFTSFANLEEISRTDLNFGMYQYFGPSWLNSTGEAFVASENNIYSWDKLDSSEPTEITATSPDNDYTGEIKQRYPHPSAPIDAFFTEDEVFFVEDGEVQTTECKEHLWWVQEQAAWAPQGEALFFRNYELTLFSCDLNGDITNITADLGITGEVLVWEVMPPTGVLP